jgi:hypothetical protein
LHFEVITDAQTIPRGTRGTFGSGNQNRIDPNEFNGWPDGGPFNGYPDRPPALPRRSEIFNDEYFADEQYAEAQYAKESGESFKSGDEKVSPLIVDLDGDGLDLIAVTASTAFFDLDNDGFVERVGWVGPDDALLAIDLDGNGRIQTRNELFGGSPSDGFASLRLLDSNADNRITAADARFADLRVWRDLNGNGVSEANELQSLSAAGITSISLASVHLTTPQTIAGNSVTDTSTFTWTAGGTGTIADVWFSVNQSFSFDVRPVTIVTDALFLPTLRGYGTLSSLTAQMSRDPSLLDLLQDFVETPIADVTDAQIRDIMYRWAGVDGIHPASCHHGSGATATSHPGPRMTVSRRVRWPRAARRAGWRGVRRGWEARLARSPWRLEGSGESRAGVRAGRVARAMMGVRRMQQ